MLHILTYFIGLFVVQHVKGLNWHMPYTIFHHISSTFLHYTTDTGFTMISDCQQEGEGTVNQTQQSKTNEQCHHHSLHNRKEDTSPVPEELP